MPQTQNAQEIVYTTPGIDIAGLIQRVFGSVTSSDGGTLLATLQHWWNIYSVIAILLSLVFIVGFIYAKIRYGQLHAIEQQALRHAEAEWARIHTKPDSKNTRWDTIQKRIAEHSPEAWRVAIIEADIFLDETLSNAGYFGQSLGEKLKSANPHSFTTVQDAWEAHKVRNEIAHVGSDFVLTQKVAQETIMRFERVFREFGVI